MASGTRCLSLPQLATLARRFWTGDEAAVAVAVALAESGGCADAHNTAGEDSRGLWQINVGPGANVQYRTWDLFDPETNARAANQVYLSWRGWGAWTAYTTGAYLHHLQPARQALNLPAVPLTAGGRSESSRSGRLTLDRTTVRALTALAIGAAALIALG